MKEWNDTGKSGQERECVCAHACACVRARMCSRKVRAKPGCENWPKGICHDARTRHIQVTLKREAFQIINTDNFVNSPAKLQEQRKYHQQNIHQITLLHHFISFLISISIYSISMHAPRLLYHSSLNKIIKLAFAMCLLQCLHCTDEAHIPKQRQPCLQFDSSNLA